MKEFEVLFTVLNKKYKTTVLAKTNLEAETKVKEFILSKYLTISIDYKKSEWNDLVDDMDGMIERLSRK
ncbi:MAG: hypothetical protein WAU01_11120 [Saprospiraceae bacterium]